MTTDSLDVMFQTFYYAYAHSNFVFQTWIVYLFGFPHLITCHGHCSMSECTALPSHVMTVVHWQMCLLFQTMLLALIPVGSCWPLHDPGCRAPERLVSVKVGFLPGLRVVWLSCPCSPVALHIMHACDRLEGSALTPLQIGCDKTRR